MSDIQYTYPLIQNKVRPPHYVTPTLRRARLLDWLHAAATCRATVIAAGAGYGKTTLLWQWEREVDFPVYWYKLDRNDRDWTLHISYLIEAISQRHPGFGRRAHSMLQQLGGPGSSRPGVAAYLLSEMHETLKEPCTFIIDDWQYVASQTEVRGLWNQILRDAPATCRFVFASRAKPQLQFARFKTHQGYAELRTDALRFTDTEIDELFRDVYNDPLDPTELAELERRTEGWAASLQLVEVSLRERKTREERRDFIESITATSDSDLFEFLAEEVLDQQGEPSRNFLLCTSILQRIEPELAERIAGIHDGARQLADLEQRGLFTYRLGPDDDRYRYHNLFREFLERRLIAERPESEVIGLHIHAGSYYETHSEWPEAIHHYLRAGLQPQAARLIAKYGEEVAAEGRIGLIDEWLRQLPAKTIHDNARLSLLHGEALGMRGDFVASLAALNRARGFFQRKGDRRMEALACLKLSSVHHNIGEMSTSARLAEEGLALVPDDARATRLRLEGNIAITSTWLNEGLQAVARACRRIALEAVAGGWEHFAAIAFHNLGVVQREMGLLSESAASLNRAYQFWSNLPTNPFADNSQLVLTLLMLGDTRTAERLAERGVVSTRSWPRPQGEAQYALANVRVQQGRFSEARSIVQTLLASPEQLGSVAELACLLLLELMHLTGASRDEWRDALAVLSRLERDPRMAPLAAPAEALGHHHLGNCRGSCLRAAASLESWDKKGATVYVVVGQLKLVPLLIAHRGSRARPDVIGSLQRARELRLLPHMKVWLRTYRPFASLLAEGRDGIAELAQMLLDDPEFWREPIAELLPSLSPSVRQPLVNGLMTVGNKGTVLTLSGISGADIAAARRQLIHRQAPRLMIRTFGGLTVERVGGSPRPRRIDKRRLRSLLGLIVSQRGKPLSRELALEALWPEADPAAAVNNLNQAAFQLRRAIDENFRDGESPAYLLSTGETIQLDPELVTTDIAQLQSLGVRMRSASSVDECRDHATAVIDLVRGPYLEDLRYEDWVSNVETSVHAEVRELLLPIAESAAGMPDLAIRAAAVLLQLDPYDEVALAAMARQLSSAGRRAAAVDVIARYAKRLNEELDEPLPEELGSLVEELTRRRGTIAI
jgi:ATP/maltotriose-dependent transcriptional regulator MalT/DNA-binding SARP family transcriptional activator